jgi:hypothetical protein
MLTLPLWVHQHDGDLEQLHVALRQRALRQRGLVLRQQQLGHAVGHVQALEVRLAADLALQPHRRVVARVALVQQAARRLRRRSVLGLRLGGLRLGGLRLGAGLRARPLLLQRVVPPAALSLWGAGGSMVLLLRRVVLRRRRWCEREVFQALVWLLLARLVLGGVLGVLAGVRVGVGVGVGVRVGRMVVKRWAALGPGGDNVARLVPAVPGRVDVPGALAGPAASAPREPPVVVPVEAVGGALHPDDGHAGRWRPVPRGRLPTRRLKARGTAVVRSLVVVRVGRSGVVLGVVVLADCAAHGSADGPPRRISPALIAEVLLRRVPAVVR